MRPHPVDEALRASLNEGASHLLGAEWAVSGQNLGMPERLLHDHLMTELKVIRKRGLHRIPEYLDELPALVELSSRTTGGTNAEHVEGLLRSVYKARSEGAQGTAIGLLLGLELGRRGANPTVLREAAATRLGYHSVDTFRKKPEANAIATFASLIESYCVEYQHLPEPDDYRVIMAMDAVQQLTLSEYAEFTRRLRHWFASVNVPESPK